MDTRECECGCGETVTGINSNTRQPIRYRPGHGGRGKIKGDYRRGTWPDKATLELLIAEHGSLSGVARAIERSTSMVRYIINKRGIVFQPTGKSMPKSPNRFGWSGEDHAALILGGEIARKRDNADSPFDVLLGDQRIEVKTARPSLSGAPPGWTGWTFHVKRNQGKNDAYFCIGCNHDGLPVAYFLIPAEDMRGLSTLRIPTTVRSKWAKYEWRPPTSVT